MHNSGLKIVEWDRIVTKEIDLFEDNRKFKLLKTKKTIENIRQKEWFSVLESVSLLGILLKLLTRVWK